jgi:outer membrane murein-binding lipoprotein Lpp
MRKLIFSLGMTLILAGFSVSCGNSNGEVSKQDSLSVENQRLNEFLDILAYTMDSINGQEKYLYTNKDGMPITNKEQIRNNIRIFKFNLEEQQKRIAELEAQLAEAKDNKEMVKKLRGIIKTMQIQLEEKNQLITQLQAELDQKNFNIAELKTHVQTLSNRVDELVVEAEETATNLETTKTELAQATIGYIIMGTKKELSSAGVLKGGFLKKKKVDNENLDASKFKSVDTRSVSTLDIPGRDAKIMSSQPSSSYNITENDDTKTCQLQIVNSSQFWEASRYLIILYK